MSYAKYLYLIGNGFDLHHSIKSSYKDFMEWLMFNNRVLYTRLVQTYELYCCDFWSNLEIKLGEIPFEAIQNDNYSSPFLIENSLSTVSFDCGEVAGEIGIKLKYLYWELQECLRVWVENLNQYDASQKLRIDTTDSLFIVFNYTNTLQTLYKVSNSCIFHIHGNAKSDDELIFGHNKCKEDILKGWNLYDSKEIEIDINSISEELMILYKDTNKIISENQAIWNRLSKIEKIYVYGLSISEIDEPYIYHIATILPNVSWIFSWYK